MSGILLSCCASGCGGNSGKTTPATEVVDRSIDGQLSINELMAHNVLTSQDDTGVASPWIELFNPTGQTIPLQGYAFSDDSGNPHKAPISGQLTIAAHQYLVVWCDGRPTVGSAHVGVTLSPSGGLLMLSRPDGTVIQKLSYGEQEVDISAAREPDASANWTLEWAVSPGAANPAGAPGASTSPPTQPENVPAAGDLSDRVLAYDSIPQFDLQIPPDSMATLRMQTAPTDNTTWVTGTLSYQGRSYGPVGISLKGTHSFQTIDQKAAFRVSIKQYAKDARFFGLSELVLNNMTTDYSMIHERVAYWLARQVGGLPALRANHAVVTVNGQLYGLYANVEAAKKEFLARAYPDPSGTLYSIHYADFQPQYLAGFQLQEGMDDMAPIQTVTSDLMMSNADQAMNQVSKQIDMSEFARYWGFSIVIGQFSSKWPYAAENEPVGNDAGLYIDPKTNLMTFFHEATDNAFYSADQDPTQTNSALTETCEKSASCMQSVVNQAWSILDQVNQLGWTTEMDRVAAQIAPYAAMDPRKPYTSDDIAMYQQQMKYFMTGRSVELTKYIPHP
jgi:hypothetical protein